MMEEDELKARSFKRNTKIVIHLLVFYAPSCLLSGGLNY